MIKTYKFDEERFIEKRKLCEEFEKQIAYGFGMLMYYCDLFYNRDFYGTRHSLVRWEYIKNSEGDKTSTDRIKSGLKFPFCQDRFDFAYQEKDIQDLTSDICYVSLKSLIDRINLIFE